MTDVRLSARTLPVKRMALRLVADWGTYGLHGYVRLECGHTFKTDHLTGGLCTRVVWCQACDGIASPFFGGQPRQHPSAPQPAA